MLKTHCDDIQEGDSVIVGLGDSFTQGIGAYSLETWKSIPEKPSMYNITGAHFHEEQAKNNWVRKLRDLFLPDYKVYNLGMNGGGNRGTIKELSLYPLPPNLKNVIVVLLATGLERYDLLKQDDRTTGKDWHQKWQTIWPVYNKAGRGPIAKLEKNYMEFIWSPRNDALEFLLSIRDLQNLCKANSYHFLFTSAFDSRITFSELKKILDDKEQFINIIDWSSLIQLPFTADVMSWFTKMDFPNKNYTINDLFRVNQDAKVPSKFITPCSHWTVEGQEFFARFLYQEFKRRSIV